MRCRFETPDPHSLLYWVNLQRLILHCVCFVAVWTNLCWCLYLWPRWMAMPTRGRQPQQLRDWSRITSESRKTLCLTSAQNLYPPTFWNGTVCSPTLWDCHHVYMSNQSAWSSYGKLLHRNHMIWILFEPICRYTATVICHYVNLSRIVSRVSSAFCHIPHLHLFFYLFIYCRHYVVRGPEKTPYEGRVT